MKILFLDQSGKLGGAELCLADIVKPYRDRCLVGLFADGNFKALLEQRQIPVRVLATQPIQVRKESNLFQGASSIRQLLPLILQVAKLSRDYDVIYANTQKALVIGALASKLSGRPLIYHLHDILSADHFSPVNRRLAVTLANRFAAQVLATSKASQAAFVAAGGRSDLTTVVYNGFEPTIYQNPTSDLQAIRQQLGLEGKFVIGHFSRLSPWKGQHLLLEALTCCPEDVAAVFVGDALYGEQAYVQQLHAQVAALGLADRVRFLGFRSEVIPLMQTCDLIVHTSTAPEPFGRVVVEAMLCGKPVIAAEAGGIVELVDRSNGWLVPPNDSRQLALAIATCRSQPEQTRAIGQAAQWQASQKFNLSKIHQQIAEVLDQIQPKQGAILTKQTLNAE
jgi:glycosyltransferase involved in cell wall biosynthesis